MPAKQKMVFDCMDENERSIVKINILVLYYTLEIDLGFF